VVGQILLLSLLFFNGHLHGIWKFLGQGLNLSPSCDLHHSCSHTRSLTHCARPGIKPTLPQRHPRILNPLHGGNAQIVSLLAGLSSLCLSLCLVFFCLFICKHSFVLFWFGFFVFCLFVVVVVVVAISWAAPAAYGGSQARG